MRKIFLTGANGFVGQRLAFSLIKQKRFNITLSARQRITSQGKYESTLIDLVSATDLSDILSNHDTVIHTAGLSNTRNIQGYAQIASAYREANVAATLNLAEQAGKQNVKRFIFLSSIKVNGEITIPNSPFMPDHLPDPQDSYAASKAQAEKGLWDIASQTGMELVIIRPPLIYGPEVRGNFFLLRKLVQSGIPLPFAAIKNKRSFMALDNLVDLIITCIDHPAASNQVFLASDGFDVSTPDLLLQMANSMQTPLRLFPVPLFILKYGAKLLKKDRLALRLMGSLEIDISKTQEVLNWTPPFSFEESIKGALRK